MDLRMPRVDGATATEALLREAPGTAVLVLTTYDTDTDIVRAIEAGASGYLLKDVPRDRLLEGIRAAARGETVLAPSVAGHLVRRAREPDQPVPTPREIEVLDRVARGLTNAEIGRELFIGESTVKTHLLRAVRQARGRRPHACGHRGARARADLPTRAPVTTRAAAPLGRVPRPGR